MKFTYFKIKNFKGIEDQTVDLTRNVGSNIFTLVGLNESGKTTILEAINYFAHKPESLDVLGLDSYEIEDIHNIIPINKRDNFNDSIRIEAGLELSDDEINEIKKEYKNQLKIELTECSKSIVFEQIYHFKNSKHLPEKNQSLWNFVAKGKKNRGRVERQLPMNERQLAYDVIKKNIPSILYFPNFLFEFPERIYLEVEIDDPKHVFYQKIIQDILDSLGNNTNIKEHLISRIKSDDKNEQRNLISLIGKMQHKLSNVIFESWNKIFTKKITEKEIVIMTDKDDKGTYLEFNIKDDVDTYRIVERSLGFRWFFVYILLTLFRSYRKKNKDAFFLFDEPASNLHPSAQSELLKSFENLPNVLYTTHSPYLINLKWLETTFIVKNKGIDYENDAEFSSKNTDISVMKYREFVTKFPSQTSYYQPILDILEYKPSNLELVPKVVITEGKNDFYAFQYYQETIIGYKDKLKIIPGTSASNLGILISLYLGWGAKFIVLLDSDKEGIKQKERYIDLYGKVLVDKIFTYLDVNDEWKNFASEKLFTDQDALIIQQTNYPLEKQYKKGIFNHSVQENFILNKKIKLSKSTLDNFNEVITFLKEKLK